jgi:cell division protein FtsB
MITQLVALLVALAPIFIAVVVLIRDSNEGNESQLEREVERLWGRVAQLEQQVYDLQRENLALMRGRTTP